MMSPFPKCLATRPNSTSDTAVEKQVKNGMKEVVDPDKHKGTPTKRRYAHNESQENSISAATKVENIVGATMVIKPAGKPNNPEEEGKKFPLH